MNDFDDLLEGTPDDWLVALEPKVQRGFEPLLQHDTPERAAVLWIQQTQGALLGKKQDDAAARSIFERVSAQVTALVCDESRYKETRQAVKVAGAAAKPALVKVIAASVAAALGLHVTVVVAPVAVVLYLITRTGRNAWCARHAHAS